MSSAFNAQCIKEQLSIATTVTDEVEIEMPKAIRSLLPALIGIEVVHPRMASTANIISKWFLSTKSNGATVPDHSDEEVIASSFRQSSTNAAPLTGQPEETIERVHFFAPVPVSKNKIYFQAYQNSGGTHLYEIRLWWVPRLVKGAIQQQSMDVNIQF